MQSRPGPVARFLQQVVEWIDPLAEARWRRRHRALVSVAAVQGIVLTAVAVLQQAAPTVPAAVLAIVLLPCAAACLPWLARTPRAASAAAALLAGSGAVAWLFGMPHALLHLLLVLALLTLYEDATVLGAGAGVALFTVSGTLLAPGASLGSFTLPSTGVGLTSAGYTVAIAAMLMGGRLVTGREQRSRDLVVHSTAEGLYAVDLKGHITFANAVAERLLGRGVHELVGGDEHALAGHSDSEGRPYDRLRCQVCRIVRDASEVPVSGQRFRRSDGRTFPVEYLSSRPRGGSDLRVVTFRDCSGTGGRAAGSTHDPLTNLPNRARFLEHAAHALTRLERFPATVAVLHVDLDRFKLANDSLGHEAGDRLLREAAERLQGAVRAHDVVARLAADEFALLCTDITDEQHLVRIAQRVLESLHQPFRIAGSEAQLGASVGIAWTTEHLTDADRLLADADAAMQRAKEEGGGRFEVFDETTRAQMVDRLRMENDLRRAVDGHQLMVQYQPKVSLTDGRIMGLEALVRWNHPRHGLISPAHFIPLAEDSGLIVPIGAWVLAEAARTAQEWRLRIPEAHDLVLAVNLSGRQLSDPDVVATVREVLRQTGTPPHLLCLEITESVVMRKVDETVRVLEELKALGVKLAVDDFGTGYSSLAYLSGFPVDVLKVDRSFVRGLGTEEQSRSICAAIIGLARALDLSTVAEGVEEDVQITALRDLGCEIAQGFRFARPTSTDEIPRLLERGSGWAPDGADRATAPGPPLPAPTAGRRVVPVASRPHEPAPARAAQAGVDLLAELDFLNGSAGGNRSPVSAAASTLPAPPRR